jgi:hypothetical protein
MPGITLAVAQARLDDYLAAEAAALSGQQYEIAGRMLRRADLAEIRSGIEVWDGRVKQLAAKASGHRRRRVPSPNF